MGLTPVDCVLAVVPETPLVVVAGVVPVCVAVPLLVVPVVVTPALVEPDGGGLAVIVAPGSPALVAVVVAVVAVVVAVVPVPVAIGPALARQYAHP